mmetsp:Transcript_7382/g.16782  ORF Transcript_7382/g.16782 Transcript_7382/m.16782 type:complete len:215 (+) Transcript_7382:359-1003(+)
MSHANGTSQRLPTLSNKLSEMKRLRKRGRSAKTSGVPVSRFSERSNHMRFLQPSNWDESVPLKLLMAASNLVKAPSMPNSEGKAPPSLFPVMSRRTRVESRPSSEGTVPVSWLRSMTRSSNWKNFPVTVGMLPLIDVDPRNSLSKRAGNASIIASKRPDRPMLPYTPNPRRLTQFLISDGMEPVSLLKPSSRVSTWRILPNSVGIVPLSELSLA